MKQKTIRILGILGGLITLIYGIAALIYGIATIDLFARIGIYYGIWGIGAGILIMIGTWLVPKERRSKAGATVLIVFGILGAISFVGWIAGPVLGLIAGIAAAAKK